jgi:hypothetical protein
MAKAEVTAPAMHTILHDEKGDRKGRCENDVCGSSTILHTMNIYSASERDGLKK